MPNRILKESIHESEKVNQMSDFQFRVWVNLITYVDDYGRGDARPAIIKGNCFPLRDRLAAKDIEAALNALADIGCVVLYEVDGRPYLCLPNWKSHQVVRNARSKFPEPPQAGNCKQLHATESNCMQLKSIESNCMQLNANVSVIQSESESNPKRKRKSACARETAAATAPDQPEAPKTDAPSVTKGRTVPSRGYSPADELTDTEIGAGLERLDDARRIVARYFPASRSALEDDPRVEAVAGMLEDFGLERVTSAATEAVKADTRGGLSVNFLAAILRGSGKAKAAQAEGYQRRAYSAEQFAALEVDLDAPDG